MLSSILHWFEQGTEDRDHYDALANLPVYDPRLFRLRQRDPHLQEYLSGLRWCLESLAEFYAGAGSQDEADRYRDWAARMVRL